MKAKRIAREYGALLLALVSGDANNKSLSGVEDKTTTDNTCLLYMSLWHGSPCHKDFLIL